jgi:hypothetical protein
VQLSSISSNAIVLASTLLVLLASQSRASQTNMPQRATSSTVVITIQAPLMELLTGLLPWAIQHPGALPQHQDRPIIPAASGQFPSQQSQSSSGGTAYAVQVPYIDLYSSSGTSIYYGDQPTQNAAFIDALPASIHQAELQKTRPTRPSLKEVVQMLSELKPYEASILSGKKYILFSVTGPTTEAKNKTQVAAIEQLEKRAQKVGIRIIEVQVHK